MKKVYSLLFGSELVRIAVGLALFLSATVFNLLEWSNVSIILYISAMFFAGLPVFVDAVRGVLRRDFLDERFLMSIASIGAVVIGESFEGAAVMLFFIIGEYFEHRATRAARSSIKSLMEIRPDTATVLLGDAEEEVDAEDVEVGALILIRPGERVPVDAVIVSGTAELDVSVINGESVPRPITVGDEIDSGSVLLGASVTARALRSAEDSRASRILELVEEASDRKSREERFITAFSRYYTPSVIALAILMAVLPPIFGWTSLTDAVYRALSFLVVSCPCALVISVPMAFFGGIGGGAKQGVLYKGGNIFSAVAHPRRVIFDKTGTLTTGDFEIVSVDAVGIDGEELLALVRAAEINSTHPIARAICRDVKVELRAEQIRELPGLGVIAKVGELEVAVGTPALIGRVGAECPQTHVPGVIYAAVNGIYRGSITLRDSIKREARSALSELRRLGVKSLCILSGDRRESVLSVAEQLGINEVHAELLPEDKYSILDRLISNGDGSTVYVGDGVNDAPCLARADVGIAMGERGSDSAIESSDVVIMSDRIDKIPLAVRSARRTVRIAKENIVFAIGVKLLALALVASGLVGMWMAVVADVGVAVLAILNSMRTIFGTSR